MSDNVMVNWAADAAAATVTANAYCSAILYYNSTSIVHLYKIFHGIQL